LTALKEIYGASIVASVKESVRIPQCKIVSELPVDRRFQQLARCSMLCSSVILGDIDEFYCGIKQR